MDSFKALWATFAVSAAAHVAIIFSLGFPAPGEFPVDGPIPIQIDDVRYEKAPPIEDAPKPPPIKAVKALRKPVKGIPIPRYTANEASVEATASADFQDLLNEKIRMQMQQIKKIEEPPAVAPKVASSMTSAELLSDPQKGKLFLGYFSQVKKKIQSIVYQRAKSVYGRGGVCLSFVLDARGRLERVSVVEKGTNASEAMRELAKQCLQEAAPFGDFPKDLGPGRIAFNITIFFDSAEA